MNQYNSISMFLVRLLIGEPSKRQRLIWSSSEKIIETCLRLKIRQCVYRISAKESCKLNSYHCCELHFFVNKAFAATLLQLRSVFHSCNFPWRKPKDVVPPPVGFLLMKIAWRKMMPMKNLAENISNSHNEEVQDR